MNRLEAELERLYALENRAAPEAGGAGPTTRAMVLELALPSGWKALGPVWQGVQADLGLPAPAIAVSGVDSYQLWFSVDQPLPQGEAQAFLEGLRHRYLAAVPAEQVRLGASAAPAAAHAPAAPPPPPAERSPGRWSAFLAPDLAALFVEEPWLDMPPGADAQAELLSRLQPALLDELRRAATRLAAETAAPLRARPAGPASLAPERPSALQGSGAAGASAPLARCFLLAVMNDPAVDLALRIEAAKALLRDGCAAGHEGS